MINHDQVIKEILDNPFETLYREFKSWLLIPTDKTHLATFIKACIALYNHGGGELVIGFDNSGKPKPLPQEISCDKINKIYIPENLQQLIQKHSSINFAIDIKIKLIENIPYPFIFIPSGVKTPACIKLTIKFEKNENNLNLIEGEVYVRTNDSNGKPSSSKPKGEDWNKLIQKCMDNREADIAKFLQRHFTTQQLNTLTTFLNSTSSQLSQKPDVLNACIDTGYNQYFALTKNQSLPKHGSFQVAYTINDSSLRIEPTQGTLNRLKTCNPRLMSPPSWAIWNSSGPGAPTRLKDGYEFLIINSRETDPTTVNYWYFTENGCFYLYRGLQDDINESPTGEAKIARLHSLDPIYVIQNITDALSVALAFARELRCSDEIKLTFKFKWTQLENRKLSAWAHPWTGMFIGYTSAIDTVVIPDVEIPVAASSALIAQTTFEVAKRLFSYFEGYDGINKDTVSEIVQAFLNRERIYA